MGDSDLKLILISSTLDCTTFHSFNKKKKEKKKIFKSWLVCDWLGKWLIILGFMDLRWPRVYRRSNVGIVINVSSFSSHCAFSFLSFLVYRTSSLMAGAANVRIVTYGLRDIYAKFKSTRLFAYRDIHFNRDMFVGGTYTSYQYTTRGNCALVYQTIRDLIKLSGFILYQVPSNDF